MLKTLTTISKSVVRVLRRDHGPAAQPPAAAELLPEPLPEPVPVYDPAGPRRKRAAAPEQWRRPS